MDHLIEKSISYFGSQLPLVAQFCLKVVISILVFYVGVRVVRWLIQLMKASLQRANVDTGVTQFLASICKVTLYALLVFNIATNFGVKEASIAALLGTSGLTLGLGLQGGLTNLVGGIMILVFRPYQVGDYIIVGSSTSGMEGTILKIEIFYTTLATIDNKTIVVPNGTLSNSCVTNVTGKDNRKLEIKVGISYESSIKVAKEILERLLKEDSAIKSDMEMDVFVDELADSAVIIGFRAWVSTDDYWKTKWRMNEKIKEAFDLEGVRIPYPQLDVRLNTEETYRDSGNAGGRNR